MGKRSISFKCPFCKKSMIEADYYPSSTRTVKGTYGGGKPGILTSAEQFHILIDKCPDCGKTADEILKAYNKAERGEITPEEHKKRLGRFKKQGLPTMIVNVRK